MSSNLESKDIEQLMAEADDLIRQINSDAIRDMKEEHRLEIEMHAQNLNKIKSEVSGKNDQKGVSTNVSHGAEGMHEAILDIVKAMQDFKNKIF